MAISAFQAHAGATILTWLADPRLELHGPDRPPTGPADLVIFPSGQKLDFMLRAPELPPEIAAGLRQGRAIAVFDSSREAWRHDRERTRRLHAFAGALEVPLERCVYLTQDRGYGHDYRAHLRAQGVQEGMRVIAADHWIRRLIARHARDGAEALGFRRKAFKLRPSSRPRRFLSLNLTPRPTKVLFLLRLLQDGLWDQGFISFGGFDRIAEARGRARQDLVREALRAPGFEDLAETLGPLMPRLAGMERAVFRSRPDKSSAADMALDEHLAQYDASWFSVVTETEMAQRPVRITEKSIKPLLNFQPLVVLGNPGALGLVRELGFETFAGGIDESYDEEPDPRRRFELAYGEIRRLCALDERELRRLEKKIYETLVHNAEWGLSALPRLRAERLDAALMDDILGHRPG